MTRDIPKRIFEEVLEATRENLTPLGYVQKGQVFRLLAQGNCGLVEFQRSDKSSDEKLVFTVNLGVVCGELLDSGSSSVHKARIIDAHLRQRIGMFLPARPDKWWEVTASTDRTALKQELLELLLKKAVPYIQNHLPTTALVALWKSGQSPGLTALQRARMLAELQKCE